MIYYNKNKIMIQKLKKNRKVNKMKIKNNKIKIINMSNKRIRKISLNKIIQQLKKLKKKNLNKQIV